MADLPFNTEFEFILEDTPEWLNEDCLNSDINMDINDNSLDPWPLEPLSGSGHLTKSNDCAAQIDVEIDGKTYAFEADNVGLRNNSANTNNENELSHQETVAPQDLILTHTETNTFSPLDGEGDVQLATSDQEISRLSAEEGSEPAESKEDPQTKELNNKNARELYYPQKRTIMMVKMGPHPTYVNNTNYTRRNFKLYSCGACGKGFKSCRAWAHHAQAKGHDGFRQGHVESTCGSRSCCSRGRLNDAVEHDEFMALRMENKHLKEEIKELKALNHHLMEYNKTIVGNRHIYQEY